MYYPQNLPDKERDQIDLFKTKIKEKDITIEDLTEIKIEEFTETKIEDSSDKSEKYKKLYDALNKVKLKLA